MDSAPQARPNLSMRPEGALLTPSKRGASQPPVLFSAAEPPRRFCAAPTSVGVRRRKPVCRATGVYSIKKGPRCAARSGKQRERAAGAVQERKRQGHQGSMPYMKREWAPGPPQSRRFCGSAMRHRTAGRARFDGGTMFPRKPLLFGQGTLAGCGRFPRARCGCRGCFLCFGWGSEPPGPRRFFSDTARRHRLGRRSRHGASAPRRRVSAFDEGSPCVGRPESIESWGPHCATRSGE